MFADEIEKLTGTRPCYNPCWLHISKNFEWFNYKDTSPYGAAGIDVIKLIGNVAQLLQESKFDKYVQGNFSSLWQLYCHDNEIECEPIRKPYGSRKFKS